MFYCKFYVSALTEVRAWDIEFMLTLHWSKILTIKNKISTSHTTTKPSFLLYQPLYLSWFPKSSRNLGNNVFTNEIIVLCNGLPGGSTCFTRLLSSSKQPFLLFFILILSSLHKKFSYFFRLLSFALVTWSSVPHGLILGFHKEPTLWVCDSVTDCELQYKCGSDVDCLVSSREAPWELMISLSAYLKTLELVFSQ